MRKAVDDEGRNPLHLAAMKGRLNVLELLMGKGADVAQARVKNGQTILHLCVLHKQKDTLAYLMKTDCQELINAVDDGGNTILHLAVADKNRQIVEYLDRFMSKGNHEKMKLNIKNVNEYTALDILLHTTEKEEGDTEFMKNILLSHKAKASKDLIKTEWLTEKRESLMIVTILIATMAFQAGVTPPGGVWQDNSNGHRAGEAVMAYNYSHYYPYFLRANTVGFVASLSIIFLLLSDLPFRKKRFMWFLVLVMWLTITSMAFTYAFSITVITPIQSRPSLTRTIVVGVIVWVSVMSILLIIHTGKLIAKLFEQYADYKDAVASLEFLKAFEIILRPLKYLSRLSRRQSSVSRRGSGSV